MKEHDAKENVQKATVELKEKEKLITEAKSIKEAAQLNQTTLNNRLTELKKSKESRMTKFHDKMPQVLEEIQKKKGLFNQVPVGPLGSFVKIRKEEWAGVCENLFGRPLNGFLVTNYHDMDRLRSILRMYNWYFYEIHTLPNYSDVPVIVSARDKFDFSSGEPDAKYDTVLRILDVLPPFALFLKIRSQTRTLNANLSFKITLNPRFSSPHVKKPIESCRTVVPPKSVLATLSTPKPALNRT